MQETSEKTKVMLHIIMPNQISGPNTAVRRMLGSFLADEYQFGVVEQRIHAGGCVNFRLIADLYRQIKAFDPDFVHLTGLQGSGFHAVIAAKLARKKVLMTVRGFSVDDLSLKPWKKFIFGHIVEPMTLFLSDRIYTVCDAAKNRKEIQRFKKKVMDTIHNAAPEVTALSDADREAKRKELGLSEQDLGIVISGRMTADKGILTIIEAIKLQTGNKAFEHCRYIFVGDGPCVADIKEQLPDETESGKVLCLGQRNDVLEILSACDTFLFATYHENLSNALLEAMAIGLPVVATMVGGNCEVVRERENGFLVPAADSKAINEALEPLATDSELREAFGKRSKAIIRDSFSQQKIYKAISERYASCLKEWRLT